MNQKPHRFTKNLHTQTPIQEVLGHEDRHFLGRVRLPVGNAIS